MQKHVESNAIYQQSRAKIAKVLWLLILFMKKKNEIKIPLSLQTFLKKIIFSG